MPTLTPKEKIEKANDEYHEAINELMLSDGINVSKKCNVGSIADEIFGRMDDLNKLLED